MIFNAIKNFFLLRKLIGFIEIYYVSHYYDLDVESYTSKLFCEVSYEKCNDCYYFEFKSNNKDYNLSSFLYHYFTDKKVCCAVFCDDYYEGSHNVKKFTIFQNDNKKNIKEIINELFENKRIVFEKELCKIFGDACYAKIYKNGR